jgi:hypothetical protein
MSTETKTYSLKTVGADSDGHGGYVRGISGVNGAYVALTGPTSKTFKTLNGAVRYMERFGYDAHGERI